MSPASLSPYCHKLLSQPGGPQQRPAPPPPELPLCPGSLTAQAGCRQDHSLRPLPPQSVGSVYSGLMQGVGAAEKVFEFIDRQPTMVHDGNLAPDHLEGRVDFENVTFTYRTRPHTKVLQVRCGLEACSDRPSPHPVSQATARQAVSLPGGAWVPVGEDRPLTGGQCGRGRPQG